MTIRLLECTAPRPDRRAIAQVLEQYALLSPGDATEQMGFLLEGSPLDFDVSDAHLSSAYRAFRKYQLEYEIVE